MKLYYAPGACSLAPHIVASEAGLTLELVRVDLATHRTLDGTDFHRINSKGAVPVLELDNGERLTEGPIIVQYLADVAGRTDLMPAAAIPLRYRVMEWQNYITSELHKSFSPLFGAALADDARSILRAALRRKYEWVNEQLGGKPFLTGDSFTGADAYLFVVSRWAPHVALELADLVHLQRFMQRVAARPATRASLQAEGVIA